MGARYAAFSGVERSYAAGPGIFKSLDGGSMWRASNTGLPADSSVGELAIDPSMPSRLYAGTNGGVLFKSTDAGGAWSDISTDLLAVMRVTVLALDPTTSGTVYAGTDSSGVFKTTDAGRTWDPFSWGLPNGAGVTTLAVDPAMPGRLYAGTHLGVFEIEQASAPCLGDCHGDMRVTVDELMIMVNIALGSAPLSECEVGDANDDDRITVDEIVTAVNHALVGCMSAWYRAVSVPGSFTLGQPHIDPASIAVFVQYPLPPFQLVRLVENVDYVVIPVNTFEIAVVGLPPGFVVPGTFDFFVSYAVAPP